jgi:hypothetical protein
VSLLVTIVWAEFAAEAQGLGSAPPSINRILGGGWNALGRLVSLDRPGAADPNMPVIFPAYFGGEFHFRPVFFNVTKAEAISSAGDIIDLKALDSRNGAELSRTGSYIESMLRFQIGRISFRGYYNIDLQRVDSTVVSVNWYNWRLGADLDVINWRGLRIGATYDYYPERPYVILNSPHLPSSVAVKICADPPQTLGLVASFSPCESCSVAPSVEFRYQWPFGTNSDIWTTTTSQITQWELSAGFVIPRTVIGQSGVRFGYRGTDLYSGCGMSVNDRKWVIDLSTSAYFGEFVWFY